MSKAYYNQARFLVFNWYKQQGVTDLTPDDVYVVWFCYILGGWKALVSTTVPDKLYCEVTYNKEKDEVYLDIYEKKEQHIYKEKKDDEKVSKVGE